MKEDKNMEMINKLTSLRAKQEHQRKMQTKQNKVKKIIKPIEEEKIDKPVEENTKKKRVVSEETKEKIRQKMLGKKHSAETIDKINEIRLLKYARGAVTSICNVFSSNALIPSVSLTFPRPPHCTRLRLSSSMTPVFCSRRCCGRLPARSRQRTI